MWLCIKALFEAMGTVFFILKSVLLWEMQQALNTNKMTKEKWAM